MRYGIGLSDLAQILTTVIYIQTAQNTNKEFDIGKIGNKDLADVAFDIASYLMNTKSVETIKLSADPANHDKGKICRWGDYFTTAEVMEALISFSEYYQNTDILNEKQKELLESIHEALIESCIYFESNQNGGMWGSVPETLRATYSYVKIRSVIPQPWHDRDNPLILPEPHIIFKALRWMCDEKQIFYDYSFQHTMLLTVFYTQALMEIYKSWEKVDQTIDQVYDDVVWRCPVRTTVERLRRIASEHKNIKLIEELKNVNEIKNKCKKLMWIGIVFSTTSIFTICIFLLIGVIKLEYMRDDNYAFVVLGVLIPTLLTIIITIWQHDLTSVSKKEDGNR